jgi:short-subunit dehydrogenase
MSEQTTILLTGAAGGIGSVIAEYFAATCSRLLLTDIDSDRLEELAGQLRARHGIDVQAIPADITAEHDRKQLVNAARSMHVNVLINNAGYNRFGLLQDIGDTDIERIFSINVIAPVLLCKAMIPWFSTLEAAHIVNIGSTFGSLGYAGFASYSASKFSLRGFSEALRRELGNTAIKVHYLAPRAIRTAFNEDAVNNMNAELGVAMDAPDVIPGAIARMLKTGKSELYLGRPERLFVKLNGLFQRLVDKGLAGQLETIHRHARSATAYSHTGKQQ